MKGKKREPASDAAWLRANLNAERLRRKHRPYKGSEERRCTARKRDGTQCRAPRTKRDDGTLFSVCRYHGGVEPGTIKAKVRVMLSLENYLVARLAGLRTKLAAYGDVVQECREAYIRRRMENLIPSRYKAVRDKYKQPKPVYGQDRSWPEDKADSPVDSVNAAMANGGCSVPEVVADTTVNATSESEVVTGS